MNIFTEHVLLTNRYFSLKDNLNPTLWENLQGSSSAALKFIKTNSSNIFFTAGLGTIAAGSLALYKGKVKTGRALIASGLAGVGLHLLNPTFEHHTIRYIIAFGALVPIGLGALGLYYGKNKKISTALIVSGLALTAFIDLLQNEEINYLELSKTYQKKINYLELSKTYQKKINDIDQHKHANLIFVGIIGLQTLMIHSSPLTRR